jgi:hypothetical protein
MAPYWAEHGSIGIGAEARSGARFQLSATGRSWTVHQVLDDPAGHGDWAVVARVDLDLSDEEGVPVMALIDIEHLG